MRRVSNSCPGVAGNWRSPSEAAEWTFYPGWTVSPSVNGPQGREAVWEPAPWVLYPNTV